MALLRPDDTWSLWAFLLACAAGSIFLEQRYKWASAISGCVLAIGLGVLGANTGLVPTESPVYDAVWTYLVPMAVPLLLFDADVRRIWRESGRAFSAFHVSALGTVLGTALATALLGRHLPEIGGVSAMFCASYIGGSVNFVAMSEAFKVSPSVINAGIVADNLLMAAFFAVLATLPTLAFFRRRYPIPYEERLAAGDAGTNRAAAYWGRKEIALKDLAGALAVAVVVAAISVKLADLVKASPLPESLRGLFGQKYLIATALTVALASLFPKVLGELRGAREIGTLLMYVFFVVIGVPASILTVVQQSPLLLAYAALIAAVNLAVTLAIGKLTKHPLETLIIASNAALGGPTTAAAMAIGKGWNELVLPAILVGVWGYVIASYIGFWLGSFVASAFAG